MMQGFEESIGQMAEALLAMPREELCRLEETVRQLTPGQVGFVRCSLESARLEGRVPAHRLTLLEYFLESWWKHSLATKLVVIDRIIELSDGGTWPGGIPLRLAKADTSDDVCAVAAY